MIVYVEILMESTHTQKVQGVLIECTKVPGCKIYIQNNSISIECNKPLETKIFQNTIYDSVKNVKYSGINPTADAKDLYTASYKTLLKQIYEDLNKWLEFMAQ